MPDVDPFSRLASRASAPPEQVLASIRNDLEQDSAKKRALTRKERVAWSAAALIVGLGFAAASKLQESPQTVLLTAAAFSLSAAGLLLGGAVPSGGQRIGLSARRTLLALLATGLFAALGLRAEHFMSLSQFGHEGGAMMCAGHALLSGVIGSSALMFLWRRSDPFSPALTGAFLGLLGGALGTLSVELLCASNEGLHLTLGHGASALLLAVAGAFVGRKWLSP